MDFEPCFGYERRSCFLRAETGEDVVSDLITAGGCLIHSVNLREVFYETARTFDIATDQQTLQDLDDLGIVTREDIDQPFIERVGGLKVDPGRMSLADCFGIALAQRTVSPFVTADHHELDRVAQLGIVQILFFR